MREETLRHREAFEYYYSLGEKRSYVSVASQFGVSERTVVRWANAFNWQERVIQRDIENSKELEKKTNTSVVNEKANYRKIIKFAIVKFAEKLKAGKIEANNIQDLERLVKLDLLLMGEATERGDFNVTDAREKLIGRINSIIERRREAEHTEGPDG